MGGSSCCDEHTLYLAQQELWGTNSCRSIGSDQHRGSLEYELKEADGLPEDDSKCLATYLRLAGRRAESTDLHDSSACTVLDALHRSHFPSVHVLL